ncbi:glycosyltransferase [Brevibacillus agri]|uniref:MGDG synthase family glycosyltransferase n=1 Tax=Brevibacillus agri TaxID=51101 RepID=UPI0024C036EE|nr:glycosyltransferase [Brevibacillus agri]MED1643789.1 glycosyltransferase [Brevibacillus agri]MED1653771.1 glycosyltransferase [Brevibacillus agri]MED1686610.1 glycosyltransferase [Brevibacillus agri]MED1691869.1 glycosyltransferase [Brevibacillus agri]MED1695926.1 glycosyltransferase [Brevibacillus agri]
MAKRFLLVTEEWAGSGHRVAAEALQEVLQKMDGAESARVIGGLQTASPGLRVLSRFFYFNMLKYAKPIWHSMYEQDEMWGKSLSKPLGWWLSTRLLRRVLRAEQPDVVIATHAYCLSALAYAKKKADKPFRLVSVPTDFHINRFWVDPQIDAYMVAHEQMAERLQRRYQIRPEKIHVCGIPIRHAFSLAEKTARHEWKKRLGIAPERFTVLIGGGEGGYGQMEEVIRALLTEEEPLQVVAVTGKNARLKKQLEAEQAHSGQRHQLVVKGFEDCMWQWIGAADVYVTKPGGITCAESLALRTPLILYQPLPGQERHNSAFLTQQNAAVLASTPQEIREIIRRWRHSDQKDRIARQMDKLRRPAAATHIAELLFQLESKFGNEKGE